MFVVKSDNLKSNAQKTAHQLWCSTAKPQKLQKKKSSQPGRLVWAILNHMPLRW